MATFNLCKLPVFNKKYVLKKGQFKTHTAFMVVSLFVFGIRLTLLYDGAIREPPLKPRNRCWSNTCTTDETKSLQASPSQS